MASHGSNAGGGETAGLLGQRSTVSGKQTQEGERGGKRTYILRIKERVVRRGRRAREAGSAVGEEEETVNSRRGERRT